MADVAEIVRWLAANAESRRDLAGFHRGNGNEARAVTEDVRAEVLEEVISGIRAADYRTACKHLWYPYDRERVECARCAKIENISS